MSQIIGVLGAGQMGSGIAQTAAQTGLDVVLYDIAPAATSKALAGISGSLDRLIKKEVITQKDKDETLKRIKTTTDFNDLKNSDLCIEAVTENETLKLEIFRK